MCKFKRIFLMPSDLHKTNKNEKNKVEKKINEDISTYIYITYV